MKRDAFLRILSLSGAVLASPLSLTAKIHSKFREKTGFKTDAGADRFEKPISLFDGDTFYTKVSTNDTDGDLYVYESSRVKKGGPNLHVHHAQDEWWYILEGEFIIKVGDKMHHVKTGDSVFGPRGVPHAFSKIGEGVGRMLTTFQPAGKMEECFIAISKGQMKGKPEAEQDEFRKQHGFERVGPPIDILKAF
ncbi:cupin domain-containing protein [Mucilaginibacter sp. SMC90]|jgi:mannose-6-phosphate isomerase-like protein (cupin superfamily)|uniref:cupin domain-containing protein n=1 Tax=unclassified Mucilaginibacter TaxID=2617802 RepID=UPI001FB2C0F9|nr:cupin domain-containing protein [Mucilaginibacter sp. SMC90]UOE48678.1 cupin domain-containing protein [Mucilaginibacter sp. SMC90]